MCFVLGINTVYCIGVNIRYTVSIKELVEEVALWAGVYQEVCYPIIVKGGCKHIFGVPHDVDDLQ